MTRRNTGSLLDLHRMVLPRFRYHVCGRCGAPIRRSRQHTNAAWYVRNGLEPRAFPMTWHDSGGSQDCDSTAARRYRREHGLRELVLPLDAVHYPVLPEQEEGTQP